MSQPAHPEHATGAGDATVLLSPDASPAPKAPAPAAEDAAEAQPLVDLLTRASDTIRAERARADALEAENARLRAQLDGVRLAFHRAEAQRPHRSSRGAGPAARASSQDDDDPLIAYVRDELGCRAGTVAGNTGTEKSQHRRSHRGSSAAGSAAASRAPSRGSVSAAGETEAEEREAVRQAPAEEHVNPRHSGSGLRSPRLDDAEESPVHAMACRLRRALAPRPSEAVLADVVHTMVGALQHDVQARLRQYEPPHRPAVPRAAPPLARGFAMVRVRPCVYRLLLGPPAEVSRIAAGLQSGSGSAHGPAQHPAAAPYRHHFLLYGAAGDGSTTRAPKVSETVLHLTIDSGALRVARGGGHVDLIEYLERRLHLQL